MSRAHVLHVDSGHDETTIIGDLASPDTLERSCYDCVILTFLLRSLFEVGDALRTVHDSIRPGWDLLLADRGIRCISRCDYDRWGDFLRLTTLSLMRLLTAEFPEEGVDLEAHGNVLADELREEELKFHDADYELALTARAVRAAQGTDPADGGTP